MDNQREAGSLMPPTGLDTLTDAARAERVEQLRTLADDALAKEFHALHEQARAVYRQDELSRAERRAQINALVRASPRCSHKLNHSGTRSNVSWESSTGICTSLNRLSR
jgi:hypothetical protein